MLRHTVNNFSIMTMDSDVPIENISVESIETEPDIKDVSDSWDDVAGATVRIEDVPPELRSGRAVGEAIVLQIDDMDGELEVTDQNAVGDSTELWTLGGFGESLRFSFG